MTVEGIPKYKEIAAKKIAERNAKFVKEWLIPAEKLPQLQDVSNWIPKSGYLSEEELKITESDASEIVKNVKSKEWSALQVTKAFCHRASIAHQLVNCLSEVFFEEAFKQAEDLDKYQEETGKVKGPFHGLPISLKDNLNIKGQATSIGMVEFAFNPEQMEEDSVIVKLFRDMGAVFYAKTNVPVAMMMPETTNHIFGNTSNPLNRNLSAGGSSGGEAALLALKGSPIGVGSDIGGSIRIPASFQNIYAIRPTFGRFPTYGSRSGLPGLESVNSVNGPLSSDLEAIELYCKSVIDQEPWNHDPKVVEIPWRKVELPSKLNVAVLTDDGWVRPTPPIRRGMSIVIDALKKDGHDIIEWNPAEHFRLSQIISSFFVSDGGIHIKEVTKATGETFFPYMQNYGTTPEMGVAQLWKLQAERTSLIKKFLDRWNATAEKTGNGKPIDAIIMPATPFPGNPNGKFHDYVGYTSPFNLVDYSVGIFPVTRADKDLDPKDEKRESFYSKTDENIWKDYDPVESHGGAVALQLVGRRHQEEKVIEMLKVVRDLL
ncbi:putative acetamidase [[Candida] railenensis]|uniref:amidase n=1 Tax=[Candida] railenensis TaxID=45579 RepID=A0A9P0VYE1_9ASCO|nr:putative acetamidase [[Candida] railenensis]